MFVYRCYCNLFRQNPRRFPWFCFGMCLFQKKINNSFWGSPFFAKKCINFHWMWSKTHILQKKSDRNKFLTEISLSHNIFKPIIDHSTRTTTITTTLHHGWPVGLSGHHTSSFGVGLCLGVGRLPSLGAASQGRLVKLGVSQSNVQKLVNLPTCRALCGVVWSAVVCCLGPRIIELLVATPTFKVVCHRSKWPSTTISLFLWSKGQGHWQGGEVLYPQRARMPYGEQINWPCSLLMGTLSNGLSLRTPSIARSSGGVLFVGWRNVLTSRMPSKFWLSALGRSQVTTKVSASSRPRRRRWFWHSLSWVCKVQSVEPVFPCVEGRGGLKHPSGVCRMVRRSVTLLELSRGSAGRECGGRGRTGAQALSMSGVRPLRWECRADQTRSLRGQGQGWSILFCFSAEEFDFSRTTRGGAVPPTCLGGGGIPHGHRSSMEHHGFSACLLPLDVSCPVVLTVLPVEKEDRSPYGTWRRFILVGKVRRVQRLVNVRVSVMTLTVWIGLSLFVSLGRADCYHAATSTLEGGACATAGGRMTAGTTRLLHASGHTIWEMLGVQRRPFPGVLAFLHETHVSRMAVSSAPPRQQRCSRQKREDLWNVPLRELHPARWRPAGPKQVQEMRQTEDRDRADHFRQGQGRCAAQNFWQPSCTKQHPVPFSSSTLATAVFLGCFTGLLSHWI